MHDEDADEECLSISKFALLIEYYTELWLNRDNKNGHNTIKDPVMHQGQFLSQFVILKI